MMAAKSYAEAEMQTHGYSWRRVSHLFDFLSPHSRPLLPWKDVRRLVLRLAQARARRSKAVWLTPLFTAYVHGVGLPSVWSSLSKTILQSHGGIVGYQGLDAIQLSMFG